MPEQHPARQVLDVIPLVAPRVSGAGVARRLCRRLDRPSEVRKRGDNPLEPPLLLARDTGNHLLAEPHGALREPPRPRAFDGLELLLRLLQTFVDRSLDLRDLPTRGVRVIAGRSDAGFGVGTRRPPLGGRPG